MALPILWPGEEDFRPHWPLVQMVKAAAAFFGHITLVGLYNAVFGTREFLIQVGFEASQQPGS